MNTISDEARADVPALGLAYSYKPSLIGAPWEFRLETNGIAWSKGRLQGVVPYRDVTRVRLSFRPSTLQHNRFLAEIWSPRRPKLVIASSSAKNLVEQERLDGSYRPFIAELHRRLAEAGAGCTFVRGSLPVLYWPGVVVFVATSLIMAALMVKALQQSLAAVLFLGAFLALFLWQAGTFFKRNRPGSYRPDGLPGDVLPP